MNPYRESAKPEEKPAPISTDNWIQSGMQALVVLALISIIPISVRLPILMVFFSYQFMRAQAMARQSKEDKALDKEIEKIYRENCANIQINMFDIHKVFAEAKKAKMLGKDMKEAIIAFVETIRKN